MANENPKDLLYTVFGKQTLRRFATALQTNGYTGKVKFRVMSSRAFMQKSTRYEIAANLQSWLEETRQSGKYIKTNNHLNPKARHDQIQNQILHIGKACDGRAISKAEANTIIKQAEKHGIDYNEAFLIWDYLHGMKSISRSCYERACDPIYSRMLTAYCDRQASPSQNFKILITLKQASSNPNEFYENLDRLYTETVARKGSAKKTEFCITVW